MKFDALELRRQWDEQGYIVVRGLVEPRRARRLLASCEKALAIWLGRDPDSGQPGNPDNGTFFALTCPELHPGDRAGVLEMLETAADPDTLLAVVRATTGFEPLFRTTSLWFNPVHKSRDGHWHRDSQFMEPTDEQAERKLIFEPPRSMQLQIALVPSDDSEYVPGSHLRWDTPEETRIRKGGEPTWRSNDMPGAVRVQLQPGDAVAFNPMGVHRGRYHVDKLRRTFMVTYSSVEHPWHDRFILQPWFGEEGYLDGLSAPARRFYEQFIETFRQDWLAPATAARHY